MDSDIKRDIIMEHYSHPKNRHRNETDEYLKVNTNNSSCIDNLDIYIKINNGVIEDISFDGEACAISISSTSIMITNLIGKKIEEALDYINNFEAMVNEEDYNGELLNEAIVYSDIYKQNNRKNCALLPYKGIKKALEDYINTKNSKN